MIWVLVVILLIVNSHTDAVSHLKHRFLSSDDPSYRRPKKPYKYHGMIVWVGIPGSGKSYRLTSNMVTKSLVAGRHVLVNFKVRYDMAYFLLKTRYGFNHGEAKDALARIEYLKTFEDLVGAYDKDIYIDEAQNAVDASAWQQFPDEVVRFFAEHRHRMCRIEMATHKFGKIHNYIRELCEQVYLVTPVFWWLKPITFLIGENWLCYVQTKDAEEETGVVARGKPKGKKWLMRFHMKRFDLSIARCYDHRGGILDPPLKEYLRRIGKQPKVVLAMEERRSIKDSEPRDGMAALSVEEVIELHQKKSSGADLLRTKLYEVPEEAA